MNKQNSHFIVEIGGLQTFAEFHYVVAKQLSKFTIRYQECRRIGQPMPAIVFDLTKIKSPRVDVLTAFLSVSLRLRKFIDKPIEIRIGWKPELFGFWDDIDFFKISKKLDLFEWPEGIIGGYNSGETNPYSKILFYQWVQHPGIMDKPALYDWKDNVRELLRKSISDYCKGVFVDAKGKNTVSGLRKNITLMSSELILNSLLWGGEIDGGAFCGIQRDNYNVTVCVCDTGMGFKDSINKYKYTYSDKIDFTPENDFEGLLVGSLMNQKSEAKEYGLRDVISTVVNTYGSVVRMSGGSGEITWNKQLWTGVIKEIKQLPIKRIEFDKAIKIGQEISKGAPPTQKSRSKFENFSSSLKGSRISFEIPTGKNNG